MFIHVAVKIKAIIIFFSQCHTTFQPKYKCVVHGTYFKCWPQIRSDGLSCMTRQHIHFAKGTLQDPSVISGLRKNVDIHIFIDLPKALNDGIKFYESENGVILTPGNHNGYLEPKYFLKVLKVNTGMFNLLLSWYIWFNILMTHSCNNKNWLYDSC